jgi:hypothetical protein
MVLSFQRDCRCNVYAYSKIIRSNFLFSGNKPKTNTEEIIDRISKKIDKVILEKFPMLHIAYPVYKEKHLEIIKNYILSGDYNAFESCFDE